jgi:hypothetical protein
MRRDDTAKSGISKGASLIARRTGLKSATVKSRIFYDPVKVGHYQVIVRSSRRPIPLIEFPSARQVGAGVRTSVWGRSQILGSAFIATMPSGHRGVLSPHRALRAARQALSRTNQGIVGTDNIRYVCNAGCTIGDQGDNEGPAQDRPCPADRLGAAAPGLKTKGPKLRE